MAIEQIDPEIAATALNQLYISEFFNKCASLGLEAQTQAEQVTLLGLAQKLERVDTSSLKTASASNNRFAQVDEMLNNYLGVQPMSVKAAADHELAINREFAENEQWQSIVASLQQPLDN